MSDKPVAMYREKCADGSRCLHGCHTNEPCHTRPQPKAEQDKPAIDTTPSQPAIDTTPSQPAIDTTPQPKQEQDEPIAFVTGVYAGRFVVEPTNSAMVLPINIALYTRPQQRKPLTDEQIDAYLESEWTGYSSYHDCFKEIVRWTEAKHGIKE